MKEKHLYTDDDADLGLLSDKVVVVVGYGTQGTARVLNMRDSGLKVIVGADKGTDEWKRAKEDSLEVVPVEEAGRRGDIFEVEVPDMAYRAAQTTLERTISMDLATMLLQDGLEFDVLSTAPASVGEIQITDLGWEGQVGKAFQVAITVPDYDVRLITVRTVY